MVSPKKKPKNLHHGEHGGHGGHGGHGEKKHNAKPLTAKSAKYAKGR
jgi:hypothetical protein